MFNSQSSRTLLTFLLPVLLLFPLILIPTGQATAQPLNQFFEIHSPDPVAYDMYQMKFTFLGPQKKIVSTLAVVGPARPFDLMLFVPWQVDYDYENDDFIGETLIIPGPEWQFFMDSIQMDPILQSTVRIPDPNCSVMIQTDMPMPMCWEHPATVMETDMLFQFLHDSIQDPVQKEIIARFRRQMAGVRQ